MPAAAAILALADADGRLEVRVSPGASADAITLPAAGNVLAVRTIAQPEGGKANDAVLRLLAKSSPATTDMVAIPVITAIKQAGRACSSAD